MTVDVLAVLAIVAWALVCGLLIANYVRTKRIIKGIMGKAHKGRGE